MLRFVVCEAGREPLPAIDLDDAIVVIGSGPDARVRLPAGPSKGEHVRVEAASIGDGPVELAIGDYRVTITRAPAGAAATPPQRTESLARELVRAMMGEAGAPSLEVERGVIAGAKRRLAPPESVLVIGRSDEADWSIADAELSRVHAEVRRTWDGIRIADLDSRRGTRVDGVAVTREGVALHDGQLVELGPVALRFRDPSHARAATPPPERAAVPMPVPVPVPAPAPPGPAHAIPSPLARLVVFYVAIGVCAAAVAAFAWLLLA